ncbi:FAD-dependent monooxygenase [Clavibacter zhangzhiyongii]|uniref:FAD-dependent monooxygenase n=1 Tax=Clavibacter zhangzhiyongii TaxID=2768071 RepID=UPI0039E1625B
MSATIGTTEQPEILIVGGSLAGLLTAHALAEAGIRSSIFERASAHRPSGAALAVDDDQLTAALGSTRATAALGRTPSRHGSAVPATWAQLHQGLRAAAERDPLIRLHHDTKVTAVAQDEKWARVTLADGSHVTGSAVIGADGYRSIVRREVDPERPDSTFAGYTLWLGIANEVDVPPQASWPRSLDFRTSGGYYLLGYPLAADDNTLTPGRRRLGWAWYDASRNDLLRKAGSVEGRTVRRSLRPDQIPDQVYDELAREARRYWPSPWVQAIVDSIERRAVTCTPISEYVPNRLTRGRLALVGDAAHVPTPMTGMGFATAVDDAASIAAVLHHCTHDTITVALDEYAKARLAPARSLVQSGQSFSRNFAA